MARKRRVEVFTAGCPVCEETVSLVRSVACLSCDVENLDMKDSDVAERARRYGVRRVPAIVVDGKLAACCKVPGIDEPALRSAGVGVPIRA